MSDLKLTDVDIVKVPYTIDGTGFTGVVKVQNFSGSARRISGTVRGPGIWR